VDIREYNGSAVKSSVPEALRFLEIWIFVSWVLNALSFWAFFFIPLALGLLPVYCAYCFAEGDRKYITIAFLLTLASTSSLIIEEH